MCASKVRNGCHEFLWMCGKHGRRTMLWCLSKGEQCWWTSILSLHICRDNRSFLGKNSRENCRAAHFAAAQVFKTQFLTSSCLFPSLPIAFIWELVALSPPCHHYKSEVRICWTVREHYRAAHILQADSMSSRDCYTFQCVEMVFVRGTVQRTSKLLTSHWYFSGAHQDLSTQNFLLTASKVCLIKRNLESLLPGTLESTLKRSKGQTNTDSQVGSTDPIELLLSWFWDPKNPVYESQSVKGDFGFYTLITVKKHVLKLTNCFQSNFGTVRKWTGGRPR